MSTPIPRPRPIVASPAALIVPDPHPYRAVNGHTMMPVHGHRDDEGRWRWHWWSAVHHETCPCQGDEPMPDW